MIVRIAGAVGLLVLCLWLLSAFVTGVTHSLAALYGRLWQLTWWLEHFGLGVAVGFVLGVVASWALLGRLQRA
jgi:hypothetical protein